MHVPVDEDTFRTEFIEPPQELPGSLPATIWRAPVNPRIKIRNELVWVPGCDRRIPLNSDSEPVVMVAVESCPGHEHDP